MASNKADSFQYSPFVVGGMENLQNQGHRFLQVALAAAAPALSAGLWIGFAEEGYWRVFNFDEGLLQLCKTAGKSWF
jgi:hypothetical protein